MSEPSKPRNRSLSFASVFYIIAGLYVLALASTSLADLWSLIVLSIVTILAGAGIYLLKRWSYWLAIAVFPLVVTVAGSTLSFSTKVPMSDGGPEMMLLNVSLGLVVLLFFVCVAIILGNRGSFGKSTPETPESKPHRGH
jgi:hypothetical protein